MNFQKDSTLKWFEDLDLGTEVLCLDMNCQLYKPIRVDELSCLDESLPNKYISQLI